MPHADRQFWHEYALPLHTRLSYLGMCLLVLHVVAALYHHFWRRDDVLRRMLPGTPAAPGASGVTRTS
jgi:cytochrome b561